MRVSSATTDIERPSHASNSAMRLFPPVSCIQSRCQSTTDTVTNDNIFQDVPPSFLRDDHTVRVRPLSVHRAVSQEDFHEARVMSRRGKNMRVEWKEDRVLGPNVTDLATLTVLAKMANDAYVPPEDSSWYGLGDGWNVSHPYGWEPGADGFRGHVFATSDNSTIVIGIKGTTASFLGSGGPTSRKDKLNDNLLWSCCCARVDWSWTTVCGCYSGAGKCDAECLEDALQEESLFYPIGTNLYNNIVYMYPRANIWVTGHSLGGGLASLIGVTFGVPVVAFESPGERMAAERLHLPSPPSTHHVTHVYHTADPVPMGACTGTYSACYIGGFALETHCHLGRSIVYDTVTKLKWAVDVRTHPIKVVIDQVLSLDWEVPPADIEEDCVECYAWEFGDFKHKNATLKTLPPV